MDEAGLDVRPTRSPRLTQPERRRQHARILARDGAACFWCERLTFNPTRSGSGLLAGSRTLDHFICRSHGGSDDDDNIVIACYRCNQKRGDRTAEAWLAELDRRDAERCFEVVAAVVAGMGGGAPTAAASAPGPASP